MEQNKYNQIIAEVEEIRSRRVHNDAASNTGWITINGTHVPIDAKGNITGNSAAAKNIRGSTGGSGGSAGKYNNNGKAPSFVKMKKMAPEQLDEVRRMKLSEQADYLVDNGTPYDWVAEHLNSKKKADKEMIRTAAINTATKKVKQYEKAQKMSLSDKADYLVGKGYDYDKVAENLNSRKPSGKRWIENSALEEASK